MTLDGCDERRALAHLARRRTLVLLGGAALAGVAGLTIPAGSQAAGHTGAPARRVRDAQGGLRTFGWYGPDSQHQALIDAALRCVAAGEACLSSGPSVDAVTVMTGLCRALAHASRSDSDALKDLVLLSARTCADCEAVCRAYGDGHGTFRTCADACVAFVQESRKLTQARH